MSCSKSTNGSSPAVLRISIGADYPYLLSPQQYVQYKKIWKVQYQVFPLFHYPNNDASQQVTAYSDRLLSNHDWVQTFIGRVFDPYQDRSDTSNITPHNYEITLMEQLNWASHLGLKTVMIPYVFLQHLSVANLTRCLLHHMQRTAFLQTILISLPIILPDDMQESNNKHTDNDAWYLWHQIQQFSNFHPQLALHLLLPDYAVEHLAPSHVQRWISEPVRYISIETASFQSNDAGYPVLPRVWQSVLKTFLSYNVHIIVQGEAQIVVPGSAKRHPDIAPTSENDDDYNSDSEHRLGDTHLSDNDESAAYYDRIASLDFYIQYLRHLQGSVDQHLDHVARYSYAYWDALQTPLQPLMDHLESQTYEVFEQDPIKYRNYQNAIAKALLALQLVVLPPNHDHDYIDDAEAVEELEQKEVVAGPPGLSVPVVNSTKTMKNNKNSTKLLPKGSNSVDRDAKRPRLLATHSTSTSQTHPHHPGKIVVMVVGAGRGPLVSAALSAATQVNVPIYVYAIEKNPNAIITLRHRAQQEHWQGQVTIVHEDMRVWQPPCFADVLVSELLGSFGDNELSPECLDAAQSHLLHPTHGVSVPAKYTSYLIPIAAPLPWMSARDHPSQQGGGSSSNNGVSGFFQHQFTSSSSSSGGGHKGLETPYVVYLRRFQPLSHSPLPVWDFVHPNPKLTNSDHNEKKGINRRYSQVTFPIDRTGCVYGFAGYFDCDLFGSPGDKEEDKDTRLSIVPATHSEGMFSWFPMFFPLLEPRQVTLGENVTIDIWRCADEHRVWYEWCVTAPFVTRIHNVQGRSSCVGL